MKNILLFSLFLILTISTNARVTCSKLKTCKEACYYLKQGYKSLDRDRDGTPCESLCSSPCSTITKPKGHTATRKSSYTKRSTILKRKNGGEVDIAGFIKLSCDQIIDKQYFKICYDYDKKGAKAVWYKLKGTLVGSKNIKHRVQFYEEEALPKRNRVSPRDYSHSGFDRGHLAPDASFDWSEDSLRATYTMSNITPQYPRLNRKVWIKAEKYERALARRLGEITVINLVKYSKKPKTFGRKKIPIPEGFYKILLDKRGKPKRCFYFKNVKNPNPSLKAHEVDCRRVKIY